MGGGRGCQTRETLQQSCAERDTVYCLQGNGIDRADTAGCNGKGWRENQSYTLNTIDRPAVLATSIDEKMGNTYVHEEKGNTLSARDYKQPQAVYVEQAFGSYMRGGYSLNTETEGLQGSNGFGDVVGALCAGDAKHIGNQYVSQGKCIIQNIREPSSGQQSENM